MARLLQSNPVRQKRYDSFRYFRFGLRREFYLRNARAMLGRFAVGGLVTGTGFLRKCSGAAEYCLVLYFKHMKIYRVKTKVKVFIITGRNIYG